MTEAPLRIGDLVWVDLGTVSGREQAGRRPVLVVSVDQYNRSSSLVLACPVTTGGKPWPFRVALAEGDGATGWVLVDQVRAVDPAARNAQPMGRVSDATLGQVQQLLAAIFNLPDPAASR